VSSVGRGDDRHDRRREHGGIGGGGGVISRSLTGILSCTILLILRTRPRESNDV
jgi:hypothetical protein